MTGPGLSADDLVNGSGAMGILAALALSLACVSGCRTEARTETEIASPQARPVAVRMKPCDGAVLKRYVDTVGRLVLQLWSADDAVGFGSKVRAHFRAALAGASLPVPPSNRSCAVADQRIGLTLTLEPAP